MLQELFNVADLPGSSVRDLFAGEDPFDQWASPLQDTHRTSGAKLVSMYTGADQNGWGATLGGMGVEMVLDPLNLASGAVIMKRLVDAKRAMAANKGIRAANAITELDNAREAGKYGFVNAKRFADDLMGGAEEAGSPLLPSDRFTGFDQLPPIPENHIRLVHHGAATPEAVRKEGFRYTGTIDHNTFGYSDPSQIKWPDQNFLSRFANAPALVMDVPNTVHRQHMRIATAPQVLPGDYVVGLVDPSLKQAGGSPLSPPTQKLIGYDPKTEEGYQWVNHGTATPWKGSDDFPVGKFDLAFVRTGEGGAAFGPGSYMAQEPNVIQTYLKYGKPDAGSTNVATPLGKAVARVAARRLETPAGQKWAARYAKGMDEAEKMASAREMIKDPYYASALLEQTGKPKWISEHARTARQQSLLKERIYSDAPRGPFHIEAKLPKEFEDQMIRGDLPMNQQPPKVMEALRQIAREVVDPKTGEPLLSGEDLGTDFLRGEMENAYRAGALQDPASVAREMTDRQVTQKVGEYLKSKGISGNKFLDQESRQKWNITKDDFEIEFDASPYGRQTMRESGLHKTAVEMVIEDAIKNTMGSPPNTTDDFVKSLRKYAEDLEEEWDDPEYAERVREVADLVEAKAVSVRATGSKLEDLTSNYAIWDQDVLDKTRIRRINGKNVPLANMLKGGRPRPVEALLDLVQTTRAEGSPLMKELPVPSLMSRKEALALGMYNAVARGGYTVE